MMETTIKPKKTVEQKLATMFGVKSSAFGLSVKEVDMNNRVVKLIGNTYFYIDSDLDMLIPGSCAKSIADRGPNSSAVAKIKHQSDHNLDTTATVGRFQVLDEREVEGKQVLYGESYIPATTKGNDDLINYQEQVYDNHSIGFRYVNLILAERDSPNELERQAWNEYFPKALNPEVAEKMGFFWVVKEIELFEISVVSFGSNRLTPNLGSKSKEGMERMKNDLIKRVEKMEKVINSKVTDAEQRKIYNLEASQLKQILTDLELKEPPKKDTHDDQNEPSNTGTASKGSFFKSLTKK